MIETHVGQRVVLSSTSKVESAISVLKGGHPQTGTIVSIDPLSRLITVKLDSEGKGPMTIQVPPERVTPA